MCKGQLMLSIFLGNCPRHLFHKVHLALCFWLFRNGHHQKGCLLCSFVTKKYNTRVKEPVFCELLLSQIVGHINAHYWHFFWINSKKVTANLNRFILVCEIAKICILMFLKQKRSNDFEYTRPCDLNLVMISLLQCWTIGAIFTFSRSRMFGHEKLWPLAMKNFGLWP